MAVDLKIELFSVDLFRNLWFHLNITKSVFPRDIKFSEDSNEYACSVAVVKAVLFRKFFFEHTIYNILSADYDIYSTSSINFYIYLQDNINKFIAYKELNVFDRLLMTCAVVSTMVELCSNNEMHLYSAPMCWAMYFDTTSKIEFYENGGWEELERVAEIYENKKLLKNYAEYNRHNDFLNATDYLEEMSKAYSIPMLTSYLKNKLKNNTNVCAKCQNLFYALNTVYVETNNNFDEFKYCECYLQILKLLLSEEEIHESEKEVMRDTDLKRARELLIKSHFENNMIEVESDLYQKLEIFAERYRALNNFKFLNLLFITDSDLDDKQCIFCGFSVISHQEALGSSNDQMERIKSAICKTLVDVGEKVDESSKVLLETSVSENPVMKNENRDILKLFFSLGVKPVSSSIFLNLKKNKHNMKNLKNSCAEMHFQKVPEDEIKKNIDKKKRRKKKK